MPFIHIPAVLDPYLFDKLRGEWPGILRWTIEGCLDWQENGLEPAATIAAATDEYFGDQDLFSQWLDECGDAEPGNIFKTAKSGDLFQSWMKFSKEAGEPPGTQKSFAEALKTKGFTRGKSDGTRLWKGIRLKVTEDAQGNYRQQ